MIIYPSKLKGEIKAISSKSYAHRFLICAALGKTSVKIKCENLCDDINATVRCLNSLGADIKYQNGTFFVSPIKKVKLNAILDCGESASTLRFLLPVCAAFGADSIFTGSEKLFARPLSPLYELLIANGCTLSVQGKSPLFLHGKLKPSVFEIGESVSSQFVSGLMFAKIVNNGISVKFPDNIPSGNYIDMTEAIIKKFNSAKKDFAVEGDWSNAAFFVCANILGAQIKISGLDEASLQSDRKITEFSDKIKNESNIKIDASQIPDLIPILAVTVCKKNATTQIFNAERLRYKESDRLLSVTKMLTGLGVDARETQDGLIIRSTGRFHGGTVDSFGDHRIAMSAAIASLISDNEIILQNAEAVKKSYPGFFDDFKSLGGKFEV